MTQKITFISDTHNHHNKITKDLHGGDILIHTGDISSMGYEYEINNFCKWFNSLDKYKYKIFIAGNHDFGFQNNKEEILQLVASYKNIIYLEDQALVIDGINIYGSPWQPEFYSWAFNLPRNGDELKSKWNNIPSGTDILLTHGPAWGNNDDCDFSRGVHLGCELLTERIKEIKPKIHCCGHIHSGNGHKFDGTTHHINASVLNEQYHYAYKPLELDWNKETNKMF